MQRNTDRRKSSKPELGINLRHLMVSAEGQQKEKSEISKSLESLYVSGNLVRSALAMSTKGYSTGSKSLPKKRKNLLPVLKKNQRHEKRSNALKKASFESKCPIIKPLKQAIAKQEERERFWDRRKGEFLHQMSIREQQKRRDSILPSLHSDVYFMHTRQNYNQFEAQEQDKKERKITFSRISKKGRLSMFQW